MALSALGRRIQWLFPPEREVYRISKVIVPEGAEPCLRCGQDVTGLGRGQRQAIAVVTRARGSKFKDTRLQAIHRGCIPTKEFETAGLPARKRRSV